MWQKNIQHEHGRGYDTGRGGVTNLVLEQRGNRQAVGVRQHGRGPLRVRLGVLALVGEADGLAADHQGELDTPHLWHTARVPLHTQIEHAYEHLLEEEAEPELLLRAARDAAEVVAVSEGREDLVERGLAGARAAS